MVKKIRKPKKKVNSNSLMNTAIGVLSITAILASAIFFYFQLRKPPQIEKVKVSLVWLNQAQFAGIYTAIEKGFYEGVGIEVELEEFGFAKSLEDDLADGKTDFSIIHAVRLFEGLGRGLDIKAVAAIYQTSPHAFATSEIAEISKPDDLRGKTLGIKGDNISAKILYSVLLSELGIDNSEVKFKSLDFSTHEFEDINNGTVDIIDLYRTDQTYKFIKNDIGYNLIIPEDFRFKMYGDIIATSGDMIEKKPKTVKKFVIATLKGWEYALEHPDEAVDFTMKYVTRDDYKNRDYNNFILENSEPLIKPNFIDQIGEMEAGTWNNLYNIMNDNNIFQEEFDYNHAFTLQFLE